MATIKIKQIKSQIGAPKDQKETLRALGLRKISQVIEVEDTPSCRGMKRNEYEGKKLYGKKKTEKLINSHMVEIAKQELEDISDVNIYRKIFYLNEII